MILNDPFVARTLRSRTVGIGLTLQRAMYDAIFIEIVPER
jgi:hypothetical protein